MTFQPSSIQAARQTLYDLQGQFEVYLHYTRHNRLNTELMKGFIGASNVVDVFDCGRGRFEFKGVGNPTKAFICEAFDKDGETVMDLVAWPVRDPERVLTLLGRCPLLGLYEAGNPATYIGNAPLVIHRSPLDWLKADCSGAAVVTPSRAARTIIDLPGAIAGQDYQHCRELTKLVQSLVTDKVRVLAPIGRVAA